MSALNIMGWALVIYVGGSIVVFGGLAACREIAAFVSGARDRAEMRLYVRASACRHLSQMLSLEACSDSRRAMDPAVWRELQQAARLAWPREWARLEARAAAAQWASRRASRV